LRQELLGKQTGLPQGGLVFFDHLFYRSLDAVIKRLFIFLDAILVNVYTVHPDTLYFVGKKKN
jgi:hypothetical protein